MATINPFNYLKILTSDNGVVVDNSGANSPAVFARQARQFVTEQSGQAEPFFLHLSIVNPHNGRPHRDGDGGVGTPFVPRRDRGTYTGPPHAQNPSFNERDVSDKTGPSASYPRLSAGAKAVIEVKTEQRRESLASADRAIARVIRTIEAVGELSDTYLIFTSDNGYLLGEHRIAEGKRSPYESAANLPLAIAGPGVPVGHEWTAAAGTQDIAPTILDIAGARADFPLDGHSILPSADRLDDDPQRAVLLEGARRPVDAENGGRTRFARDISVANTDWLYRAVVTRRWKLIRWDQTDTFELYNLRHDPYEVESLYGRRRYVERGEELRARLRLLRMCQAGTCEN
ncbi:MAG: sulfatase-like hydrolase/transferase [Nocardioidaceae bacterium]|nr:sulfatase-like hydrolase/transferase [Nocardioidaceae bacterium]